jgi:hypothetical protein
MLNIIKSFSFKKRFSYESASDAHLGVTTGPLKRKRISPTLVVSLHERRKLRRISAVCGKMSPGLPGCICKAAAGKTRD